MGNMELRKNAGLAAALMLLTGLFMAGCGSGDADYAPKPRGYFRIELPEKQYKLYSDKYPFTFLYPAYAKMEVDSTPYRNTLKQVEYKLNMQFPQFNGTLHLTYQSIT